MSHELHIQKRGPWDTPPTLAVIARCSCGAWSGAWTQAEYEEAGVLDEPWTRILEAVRLAFVVEHAQRHEERAAIRPGPDFY